MKAIYYTNYGTVDELKFGELPDPVPANDEVLIKVAAASVNPVDWKVREGRLKLFSGRKFPLIPGTELAGTVVSAGSHVSDFKSGDRVFAGLSHKGGAYAEYVTAAASKVIHIPDELSFREASTLAVAGVTPLQAFTIHYRVKPGDEVLVNGGSGGVGTYAIQISKVLGARVTAVCSAKNAELVSSLGADEVIDYNREDFRNREKAFDVVLDAASNAFFADTRNCLKPGGMLIKLNLSIKTYIKAFFQQLFSSRKMKMILLKSRKEDLQWMITRIISGNIRVVVDRVFPFTEAKQAHLYSESGRARGKIILDVDIPDHNR